MASGSPAIGKGTDLSLTGLANDFSGVTWPQDSDWDIGAYESVSDPSVEVEQGMPDGIYLYRVMGVCPVMAFNRVVLG